jgi:arachidonate 5-lipoxygenase
VHYVANVKTGDQLHAGTDANIYIVLYSESGHKSKPINLDYFFRNDFERGQLDQFKLKNVSNLGDIHKIEIWRDDSGIGFSDWFLDYIEIEAEENQKQFMFPVFRWIKPHKHYIIHHMDNFLPQFDPEPKNRLEQLEEKRRAYECATKVPDGPAQVR